MKNESKYPIVQLTVHNSHTKQFFSFKAIDSNPTKINHQTYKLFKEKNIQTIASLC